MWDVGCGMWDAGCARLVLLNMNIEGQRSVRLVITSCTPV
jgi:hypothetical protein